MKDESRNPSVKLTQRERERYNRQIMIPGLGLEGQRRLKASKVFLAGAGGLGCPIAIYLAVAGVGTLRIVDKDTVELSNLNRQVLHWDEDIGKRKTESIQEKLRRINPDIEVEANCIEINEENFLEMIEGSDVIVDAMDNFPTRYLLNKAAVKLNIPFIHGGIWGLEGRATTIIPFKTACLSCVIPEAPPSETFPVIGVSPGLIAMIEATETIKYLTGVGSLLENRLLIYDGELMKFTEIELSRRPDCPVCGGE
jgi:molybdopterin/thiamine biosynthesis adenylyltransferase